MCSLPSCSWELCRLQPLPGPRGADHTGGEHWRNRPLANRNAARRVVDLSHPVTNDLRVYPGIPTPKLTAFLTHEASRPRYQGQCELLFSEVHIVAGVGTYLDSPYHRDPALPDFSDLPLPSVADLPGIVIDVRERPERAIRPDDLGRGDWSGCAVLLRTGMEEHWETDRYWQGSPFLLADTAETLQTRGVALLGVDFLNVDDVTDLRRPVHTTLLRARVPIVENLRNIAALPQAGFRFHAAPARLAGVASFPIRAYAVVEG